MERVKTLVRKLQQKIDEGCSAESLLLTVNLLQSELLHQADQSEKADNRQGVYFIAPQSVIAVIEETVKSPEIEQASPTPPEKMEPISRPESEISAPVEEAPHIAQQPESEDEGEVKREKIVFELAPMDDLEMSEEYDYLDDEELGTENTVNGDKDEAAPSKEYPQPEQPVPSEAFDPLEEVPTLFQQSEKPAIKKMQQSSLAFPEDISHQSELNDILNQQQSELGDKLKKSPIKDIRKAIGVNDRYLFINELFRGDESTFKRSIKTIQNFSILPEAEYWIKRELKIKLGWDNENPLVKQFDNLVKRRFS